MTEESKSEETRPSESAQTETGASQAKKPAARREAHKPEEGKFAKLASLKPAKEKKSGPSGTRILFTGRRKESVSRVKVVKGNGVITINGRTLENYFPRSVDRTKVKQPLTLLGIEKEFDVHASVYGGGTTGQSEAIRLGISRAIHLASPEYHSKLKEQKLLTRDSRMVERKKYGLHKARRASQFSKR